MAKRTPSLIPTAVRTLAADHREEVTTSRSLYLPELQALCKAIEAANLSPWPNTDWSGRVLTLPHNPERYRFVAVFHFKTNPGIDGLEGARWNIAVLVSSSWREDGAPPKITAKSIERHGVRLNQRERLDIARLTMAESGLVLADDAEAPGAEPVEAGEVSHAG